MNNIDKVKLPSAGLVGDAPAEIVIRGMKGKEISTLFSSFTEAAIEEIIKSVTDPSVDPNMLCDEDKKYILHQTRVLTFGNTVEQTLRCPFCGKIHNYEIDYDNFKFTVLDEDILNEKIVMPDGKVIAKAIPTKNTWDVIYKHKEKRGLPDSYAYILLQAAKIKSIDHKKKTIAELIDYLENLPGRDLKFLSDKLNIDFGLDTTYVVECQSCHTSFTGGIGINADMFR